jgi:hypothetical protein
MKKDLAAAIAVAVIGLLLAFAAPANCQLVTNPTSVQFDHTDFATATRYDGGYFLLPVKADNTCDMVATPGVSPVQTDNLGKPATTTGVGMQGSLVAKPIGCYVYKVRALDASGLYSEWSSASNPFLKRPATPAALAVK